MKTKKEWGGGGKRGKLARNLYRVKTKSIELGNEGSKVCYRGFYPAKARFPL